MGAVAVKQANDVILLVVEVSVGSTIEHHHSRLVLCIVEEVQFIASSRHVHNILAVQRVLRHNTIDNFLHSKPTLVVNEPCIHVVTLHPRQLPPVFPRVLPCAIA